MASITSVISLFVLLLATYCYSAPIQQEYLSATPDYESTSGKTIIDRENTINMHLLTDEETTDLPNIDKEQTSDILRVVESTTPVQIERHEDLSHISRMVKDLLFPSTSELPPSVEIKDKRGSDDDDLIDVKSTSELPPSVEINDKRDSDDDLIDLKSTSELPPSVEINDKRGSDDDLIDLKSTSELPPSVEINDKRGLDDDLIDVKSTSELPPSVDINDKRGLDDDLIDVKSTPELPSSIGINDKHGFESDLLATVESTTDFERRAIRPDEGLSEVVLTTPSKVEFSEDEVKVTTVESLSSVDTFGKYTGLLTDDHSKEELTTPKSEKADLSDEEPTSRIPVKTPQLTRPVSIISGSSNKVIGKLPETKIVDEHVPEQQKELSQGENEPIIEKEKSNNWNGSPSG